MEVKIIESKINLINDFSNYDYAEFGNELDEALHKDIDEEKIFCYLSKCKSIENIRHLKIGFNSKLEDLKLVKFFPNIKTLGVYSKNIKLLDGLEYLKKIEIISIETLKNNKRSVEKIEESSAKILYFRYGNKNDLLYIGQMRALKELHISKVPEISTELLCNVPLEYLKITQSQMVELSDLHSIKSLEQFMIGGCRGTEKFIGDNSGIKRIIVTGCKKLDLKTLDTFKDLEDILVNGSPKDVYITDLKRLTKIKKVSLYNCNLILDAFDLKSMFPLLESLNIDTMPNIDCAEFSRFNPNVEFVFKDKVFLNGVCIHNLPKL